MPKPKSQIMELYVESIGFEGVAIAKNDGKVVFVKKAIPGDEIIADVKKNRKKFLEAHLLEIKKESPDRIKPICDHFGDCGGCSWQMLNYKNQLKWKTQNVIDSFERIGGFKELTYEEILQSPSDFYYRNKMEFTFGANRWLSKNEINNDEVIENKDFALGLHVPGRYDRIIDIKRCHIHNDYANGILNDIKSKAIELGVSAYSTKTQTGFLRSLMVRYSASEDRFLLVLMTKQAKEEYDMQFIEWYKTEFSEKYDKISELYWALRDTPSPVNVDYLEKIKGNGYLTDEILGIKYQISPFSFFQTNSIQLNSFIESIIEKADLNENDVVWDLYCGTGSISLPAAKRSKVVYGLELVEESISDAKKNSELNSIDNVVFEVADLHDKKSPATLSKLPKPDKIIVDPPRAGMHPNLVSHLLEIGSPRIVYVSCNPATQARDCKLLSEKYEIKSIKPVDMFPQTYHVESIAVLDLK